MSRKMRKLEEKSSLAGKGGKDGSGTGSNHQGPGVGGRASTLYGSSILTQDLHAAIADAVCGILAPVDAEKQEAQD